MLSSTAKAVFHKRCVLTSTPCTPPIIQTGRAFLLRVQQTQQFTWLHVPGRQLCNPVAAADSADGGSSPGTGKNTPLKYKLRPLLKEDMECSFARSGGPGGQNVNKVNTKVDMRWEIAKAGWVPQEVKDAIAVAEKNRFNKEGWLVLTSTKHRNQAQNLDDALEKMQEILDAAVFAVTPRIADPETVKRVKANIKAGDMRRLNDKKADSSKRKERSSKNFD